MLDSAGDQVSAERPHMPLLALHNTEWTDATRGCSAAIFQADPLFIGWYYSVRCPHLDRQVRGWKMCREQALAEVESWMQAWSRNSEAVRRREMEKSL